MVSGRCAWRVVALSSRTNCLQDAYAPPSMCAGRPSDCTTRCSPATARTGADPTGEPDSSHHTHEARRRAGDAEPAPGRGSSSHPSARPSRSGTRTVGSVEQPQRRPELVDLGGVDLERGAERPRRERTPRRGTALRRKVNGAMRSARSAAAVRVLIAVRFPGLPHLSEFEFDAVWPAEEARRWLTLARLVLGAEGPVCRPGPADNSPPAATPRPGRPAPRLTPEPTETGTVPPGGELRRRRHDAGLSQAQVAAAAGLSRSVVSAVEGGRRDGQPRSADRSTPRPHAGPTDRRHRERGRRAGRPGAPAMSADHRTWGDLPFASALRLLGDAQPSWCSAAGPRRVPAGAVPGRPGACPGAGIRGKRGRGVTAASHAVADARPCLRRPLGAPPRGGLRLLLPPHRRAPGSRPDPGRLPRRLPRPPGRPVRRPERAGLAVHERDTQGARPPPAGVGPLRARLPGAALPGVPPPPRSRTAPGAARAGRSAPPTGGPGRRPSPRPPARAQPEQRLRPRGGAGGGRPPPSAACRPSHRAVLWLREWQALDYDQISRVLGISRASTKAMLWRARARFREEWSRQEAPA